MSEHTQLTTGTDCRTGTDGYSDQSTEGDAW
jgi:hypothetical protein